MSTWLPYLFKFLLACIPLFTGLAAHNYSLPVPAKAPEGISIARPVLTHGMALLAASSVVGAAVVHHKISAGSGAAIPSVITQPGATDRERILLLLWQDIGPQGSQEEYEAFKKMQAASVKGKV